MWNPLTPRKTFKRRLRACELHLVDLEQRYSTLENNYNVKLPVPPGTPILDGSDQNC
jgi:hypothetical protein